MDSAGYLEIVERRRQLAIPPFRTVAEVEFDGPWVTPYQKAACSPDGPVLLALHWLDEDSIHANRPILRTHGYLPNLRFNQVLDRALAQRGLTRRDIYVTQAFHLIPRFRSEAISPALIKLSFDAVTRYELAGRKVLALGDTASRVCRRHGIAHHSVCHPSRRGYTFAQNATEIAHGLARLGF